jgi:hypothetical protein
LISGVCAGNYTVSKSLTLEGKPTTAVPKPTLDGRQTASVVTVTAGTVRFKKLTIQNGYAVSGGGIVAAGYSNLILNATTVAFNTAAYDADPEAYGNEGGGIWAAGGTVTLNTGARVVNNTVEGGEEYGGGIYSSSGDVYLNGNALVAFNYSGYMGGGIHAMGGRVLMRATAAVRGNEARWEGGGIVAYWGNVVMDASSVVTRNQAEEAGGIYGPVRLSGSASVTYNTATGVVGGGIIGEVSACSESSPDPWPWVGAISPNTPDNPPEVEYVTCT